MISVYNLKPRFQQALKPLLHRLYKMNVTANHLTLFALFFSASVGIAFWFHPSDWMLLLLPAALLVRMALNALDGMMARTYSMQSKLGEVLNEFGDVVSDMAMYIPLVKLQGLRWEILIGFVMLGMLNEFAGVLAKVVGGERRYDGPMGKSDRALLIGLTCIVIYIWPGLALYLKYVFLGAMALLILSTYKRLQHSLNN